MAFFACYLQFPLKVIINAPLRNCLIKEILMKKWECIVCGWIYDESKGWPEDGIAPGTRWEDVPEDWLCPDCGVGKEDFEMVEI